MAVRSPPYCEFCTPSERSQITLCTSCRAELVSTSLADCKAPTILVRPPAVRPLIAEWICVWLSVRPTSIRTDDEKLTTAARELVRSS